MAINSNRELRMVMARPTNLPAINQSFDVSEYRSQPSSRMDFMEERMARQERTSHDLIDKAYKIKEEVVDSLQYTRGTWQEEQKARSILAEHIKTITAVVNRLNHDIAVVEDQLKARDNAAIGTNTAVKNLEVHHVASLTDLRGRVVRCDAAIAKLSSDTRGCSDGIKSLNQQQQDGQSRMLEKMHQLEAKINNLTNHMDKAWSEQKMKLQTTEGSITHRVTTLDGKTKSQADEFKTALYSYKSSEQNERERLEARFSAIIEKDGQIRDIRISKAEKSLDDVRLVLDQRFQRIEDELLKDRAKWDTLAKSLENRLVKTLDAELHRHGDEIMKVKRECREGFSTVHETIINMKTVMDGKLRLLEEQLRKEIAHIRKMVVLV